MVQAKLSGVSGCSDSGSVGSARSTELVLGRCSAEFYQAKSCLRSLFHPVCCNRTGVKSISEDTPAGRVLLRKEVLRLVINLSSSVGTKNHETNLLT